MKYLVIGTTANRCSEFMKNVCKELRTEVWSIVGNSVVGSHWYVGSDTYETISAGSNCRGRRADMVLFENECFIGRELLNSILAPYMSWDEYLGKNKYQVELL